MIRVLIVDDDKLARKGLISIMPWAEHGMSVAGEAANGAKALEFLEQHEADLLFVDLSMPVMSGLELIQATRRKYPNVRSVVLSFHEEFENVQTAYRMGVLDYISKVRLESEDNEQILRRIRQRLLEEVPRPASSGSAAGRPQAQAASPPPSDNPARPMEEEQWRKLEQEWRSQHWLYNEAAFQRLCKATAEAEVPVRRLEALFMRVLSRAEAELPIDANLRGDAADAREAIEGIRQCRKSLYAKVASCAKLASTAACIVKAVLFIRERAAGPLHAEDVADHVGMSRSYFCQTFKKLTGATFNEHLRQERIRAAERLLCETNQSIAWVAHAVGYEDSKYFSHLFYEQTRLLPSEFRAQFKGDS